MTDDAARAEAEIVDLHAFFEGWIAGALPNDDATYDARFLSHLADGFAMVQPGGSLTERAGLAEGMRAAHGANPDFRIRITDVRVRMRVGDVVVSTYTEWQKNAKSSMPANNARRSSVVFRDVEGRLLWSHLHETWVPADEMASGSYDF